MLTGFFMEQCYTLRQLLHPHPYQPDIFPLRILALVEERREKPHRFELQCCRVVRRFGERRAARFRREIREADGHMLMTGPAALAYRGEIDLGALAA